MEIYTVEQYRENYDVRWELLFAGTDLNQAKGLAQSEANSYHEGKTRLRTWKDGTIINEEMFYEKSRFEQCLEEAEKLGSGIFVSKLNELEEGSVDDILYMIALEMGDWVGDAIQIDGRRTKYQSCADEVREFIRKWRDEVPDNLRVVYRLF